VLVLTDRVSIVCGYADSNAVEAEAYLSSGPSSDTDINLVLLQLPNVTPEAATRYGAPPADAFTIMPALVQPTSRGAVRLASDNFQDAAVIDCNYLGADHEFAAIVRAIEAARELGNQRAFDSVREIEVMPGPKATAEEIRNLPGLARRASDIPSAHAKWVWTSSLLSTQSFACTALWVYAWQTPP
jgi:choline dehydrogenase